MSTGKFIRADGMEHLLKKAREGDRSAEQEMFQYLLDRFNFLARRRMNDEEAEDVAQEACLTVLKKYQTDAPPEGFMAWAYNVLRNKIGNYYQHQTAHRKIMTDASAAEKGTVVSTSDSDIEERLRLFACLKTFIRAYPRFARVLNLVYQGYTTSEICRRLGITANNLYVILTRSRKILSDCLEERGKI
jgi:RNA polymerase sigma factor (sigma-70 family)